jgi:cytidylate kinase
MAVITIRGQLGSGAPEIGKLVASKLGYDYVDREIIADVAAHLKWTEKGIEKKEMPPGTLWGRIAESLAHTYPINTEGVLWMPTPIWETVMDDDHYLEGLKSVIKELAANNSIVIRGRGSQFILKDYPGTLHILVIAPLDQRIKRVMDDLKVDESAAGKEIEQFDGSRREFTKRYFSAELEDPLSYDLVLNTLHLSLDNSASIIVRAVGKED